MSLHDQAKQLSNSNFASLKIEKKTDYIYLEVNEKLPAIKRSIEELNSRYQQTFNQRLSLSYITGLQFFHETVGFYHLDGTFFIRFEEIDNQAVTELADILPGNLIMISLQPHSLVASVQRVDLLEQHNLALQLKSIDVITNLDDLPNVNQELRKANNRSLGAREATFVRRVVIEEIVQHDDFFTLRIGSLAYTFSNHPDIAAPKIQAGDELALLMVDAEDNALEEENIAEIHLVRKTLVCRTEA